MDPLTTSGWLVRMVSSVPGLLKLWNMLTGRAKKESETTKILRPIMNEMARINAVLELLAEKLPNAEDREQVLEMLGRGAHPQSIRFENASGAMGVRMTYDTAQDAMSPHLSDALRTRRAF